MVNYIITVIAIFFKMKTGVTLIKADPDPVSKKKSEQNGIFGRGKTVI